MLNDLKIPTNLIPMLNHLIYVIQQLLWNSMNDKNNHNLEIVNAILHV